jgi:hypothetical protein
MGRVPAIAIVSLIVAAWAPQASAKTETVTGQVIDLACYMLDTGNTGNTHRGRGYACAQACAKEGFQVGLLTTDAKVYEITGDLTASKNAKLAPHMGHTVTMTGDVSEKDGVMMIAASELRMVNARLERSALRVER